MKDSTCFWIIAAVVFLSRVPFIDAGYGIDPDAWRVANSSHVISAKHEYMASRLPGNPLQEITYSFFWNKQPVFFNITTAFLSGMGIAFFGLTLKKIGSRDSILTALALACTPVVYINSVNSMDYMWALSFVLGSLYCVVVSRPLAAGILLGMAVGCRITSGAMVIPFGMIILNTRTEKSLPLKEITKFLAGTLIISAITFLPVMIKYGPGFFTFVDGYPSFGEIIRNATIEVWGIVGCIALLFAAIVSAFTKKASDGIASFVRSLPPVYTAVSITAILLYVVAFLRLPGDAGYLIPALPFVFLLLTRFVHRTVFMIICISVIASSFFVSLDSIDRQWSVKPSPFSVSFLAGGRVLACDFLKGPIFNDYFRRKERMKFVDHILSFTEGRTTRGVIVSGSWLPQLAVTAGSTLPENTERNASFAHGQTDFVGLLDKADLMRRKNDGYNIFYIKGQEVENKEVCGVDLRSFGALEIQ